LRTPLHLAAAEGHETVVRHLLKANAAVNPQDRWGCTPLADARRNQHEVVEKLLLEAGATIATDDSAHGHTDGRGMPGAEEATDPNRVEWEDIKFLDKIGSGAFGEIYKCRWRGTLVAAKTIKSGEALYSDTGAVHPAKGGELSNLRRSAIDNFKQEIGFLLNIRHPNICMLLGYSLTDRHEVMLSELMKCSLLDLMNAASLSGSPFSLERTLRYTMQFAQGMNFLHTCKPPVIHRDLKPANLLIDYSDVLKVADFGLAKVRPMKDSITVKGKDSMYEPFMMTGETGSYRYMAPEVFRHEDYGRPVDVYSFSMILVHMLNGLPPWAGVDGVSAVRGAALHGSRPEIPRHWDGALISLLRDSWAEDPQSRPSFAAVLEQLHKIYLGKFKVTYEQALKAKKGTPGGGETTSFCAIM